jgi:hypothetical protein
LRKAKARCTMIERGARLLPAEGDLALLSYDKRDLLENIPLKLDPASILRNLGGGTSPWLEVDVERWRAQARPLLAPRMVYRRVPVTYTGVEGVELAGGHRFASAKLGSLFTGAEWAIVAVGTIGPALEEEVSRLFARCEYMDAMLLDAIGTTAVEDVGNYLRSRICRECGDNEGLRVGPSLSPGYQYWDIRDQEVVFNLVPGAEIGVILTESCLMLPRKSESLVVPLGRQLKITAEVNEPPCRYCDRRDCPSRVC